ncbi:Centriole, cilia and spindle-associated protein [Collichthys lucidus]|uniref:Centriole, cilia and spindle-associated protein n=1 Tax=Collichthys lucidus TaxID=240159 RepID=A0A4V6AMU4_COLLU|nr:Centriole, cilia and spindle-associated protein [Collichthys lucidus]
MVTKRIHSEYMKKFKDPKWETYAKCYEEMLKYRLTRRLLEHTHNPWFWSGSDTDSDSGGRSPLPPSKNQVRAETSRDRTECEGPRVDRATETVPRLPLQEEEEEEEEVQQPAGPQAEGARETRAPEEQREEERRACSRGTDRDIGGPQQTKPKSKSKSSKQIWRSQRVRPAPPQQPTEDSRHPFALYGSGEKDADIAGRKTHNVGPAASTSEIHESALRAKTRRAVERQIQTQRTERRRAKSADMDKTRNGRSVKMEV